MKKLMIIAGILFSSHSAQASGFICEAVDTNLNVKVYNHTQNSEGTKVGAIMVLSDPSIQYGRKTIASFESSTLLKGAAFTYSAQVDLRYSNSSKKGENIGGTKLGQLEKISLDVDFTYAAPLENGDETTALLSLYKRNGDQIHLEMICVRYLKD